MEAKLRYIQVVVPLRLSWNPTYSTDDQGISVGDRVKVRVSGHLHDAVVIAADITPDIDRSRIQPIEGIARGLERITSEELELWKFISTYYLCTLGEVYKSAYPSGKIHGEEHAAEMTERRNAMVQRRADEAEAKRQKRMEKLRTRISAKEADLGKRHSEEVAARLREELETLRMRLASEENDGRRTAIAIAQDFPEGNGKGHAIHDADAYGTAMCSAGVGTSGSRVPMESEAFRQLAGCLKEHGSRPVLVDGDLDQRQELYFAAAAESLGKGKSVLYLCPEVAQSKDAEAAARDAGIAGDRILSFRSSDTAAHRRKVAAMLRDGGARVVFGTRAALFLPFRELGLIIVDEEQDSSYKQDSPAPRFNARDTGVMLASIHHASAILGSATPSLESLYNVHCGRYGHVSAGSSSITGISVEVIDTTAEKRKCGMAGQISRKLIEAVKDVCARGGKAMVITTWNDKASLEQDVSASMPQAQVFNMKEARTADLSGYALVALIHADTLLGGEDFRTDEKALQIFDRFRHRCCGNGRFFIQTSNSDHQVFLGMNDMAHTGISSYGLLLPEREMFGFPPFSRIVDAIIRDERPKRLEFMSGKLMEALNTALRPVPGIAAPLQISGPIAPESWKEDYLTRRTVRVIIRKDSGLAGRKAAIQECVRRFEKEMKYIGHISIDVDPL